MESFNYSRGPGKLLPAITTSEKRLLVVIAVLLVIGIALVINTALRNKSIGEDHRNSKNTCLNYTCIHEATGEVHRNSTDPCLNSTSMHETTGEVNRNSTDLCLTSTCIHEASNLVESMDSSVDPCKDFYSFVCGNWIRNNYLSSNLESQFTKLSKIILLRIKEILEFTGSKDYLPLNKKKTVDFYEACMDKFHRTELGAEELLSDLKKLGGWPLIEDKWNASSFDWATLMTKLFKKGYLSTMLFSIKVVVDIKNTSRSIIEVNQPTLGLIYRQYYSYDYKDFLEDYQIALSVLATLLRSDIDSEKCIKDIEEAFEIEDKIAHLKRSINVKYPETFYNIMSLEELVHFAPKIPWRKIFTDLLPSGTVIADSERIMVVSPDYIENLNNMLEDLNNNSYGRRNLANYMFYRVVFNAAKYLSKKYYTVVNDLFESSKTGPPIPWEVCAKTTLELFPLPLTASYVSRYADYRTKKVLGMMFEDLRDSLTNNINDADWLHGGTKSYALFKVKKIRAEIGYQDEVMDDDNLDAYYRSVYISDNHFSNVKNLMTFRLRQSMKGLHEKRTGFRWFEMDNLLTANAYYAPLENTVTIPIGILQDTMFAANRPNYINYGSLGTIVGHELSHAFDDYGSLYDAEGNYRKWWSEESWNSFESKKECFEKQYNRYYVPEAKNYVNGKKTLSENMADNGGVKAAYYAYNALLKRIGSEKSLPGLHDYNEKQMFWIAFGSVWCRKQTDTSIQYNMKHAVHTISNFRVIGTLSNMEEFSEDFKCKLGSTMNPASKCTLWK